MNKPKVLGRIDLSTGKYVKKTIWYYVPSFIRRWF